MKNGAIAERIKRARENARLSQGKVAKALGISQVAVLHWEKGISTPKFEYLEKLSEILNVSIDYIIKG